MKNRSKQSNRYEIVGDFNGEGPPVPIPNTEVKLTCAEDTWLEAAWENRSSPTFSYSSIAQSVERMAWFKRVRNDQKSDENGVWNPRFLIFLLSSVGSADWADYKVKLVVRMH